MPFVLASGVLLLGAALLANPATATREASLLAEAAAVHARVLTIDSHIDIPPDFGTAAYDMLQAKPPRQKLDLP